MSDDFDYDDDNENGDERGQEAPAAKQGDEPGWRKRLTKDRDTARSEVTALKRENAFLKAGVNPEDPKAKWLVKGYDGELTADAVRAAATEAGLLEAAVEDADVIPAEERAAHERIAATTTGARSTGSFDYDSAIAEARAAGQMNRVIELKQAQSHAARAQ